MKKYQLGLYEKAMPSELSWREKLNCAGEIGYDFVEISIDETDAKLDRLEWSKEKRSELIALMKETGVPIRSMCLSGHRKYPFGSRDKSTRDRSMEIMEKAVVFAADLGIRIIQLAGYDVYYEQGDELTRQYFTENLHKAAETAAVHGVLLGFETMETEFMNTVEKAMRYVTLVDSPYLNVYPDIGNLTNAAKDSDSDVLEDLQCGHGRLIALHLKETRPGVFREVPFGEGHVDFPTTISKAWSMGVRRYVTEMWYTGNVKWKDDIIFAHKMVSELLNGQKGC